MVVGVSGGRLAMSLQTPAWSRNCQQPPLRLGEAGPRKLSRNAESCALVRRLGQCCRNRNSWGGERCREKSRGREV